MDEQTQQQAFDPLLTTKAAGTGLGLATVYGIVRQSGAHIQGLEGDADEGVRQEPAATRLDGTETILLVEDAEILRPVAQQVLESYGYRVLAAASGREALAIAAVHGPSIDLLLTDLSMPGMSGQELATTLTADLPSLRVLFTSGYPTNIIDPERVATAQVAFIQKPYLPDELAAKIRTVLEAA